MLRAWRDEWIAAGVFEALKSEALAAFDRIVGLDLSEVSLDGSLHKAPCGGEGTGQRRHRAKPPTLPHEARTTPGRYLESP